MRTSTKISAVVGGGALVVATAGAAYAYWSTSGSGSGTASTTGGTANALTFTQNPNGSGVAQAVAAMYPGDTAQALTVVVKNTSGESAYVANVRAYITTNNAGCTGSDFLLGGVAAPSTAATAAALTWTAQDLAAGGSASATSTVQFNNKAASNQDACKGATVTINYLAS